MLDQEAPPENRRPIAWLHEADISLNWKKLLDGQVDPERVNVEGLSVSMPVDKERPERVFSVAGLNAEIDLNRPGMVDLTKAEAVVQGIRVTAQGSFPAGQEEGGDFVLTPGDVAAVRKQLDRVLLECLDGGKGPESARAAFLRQTERRRRRAESASGWTFRPPHCNTAEFVSRT